MSEVSRTIARVAGEFGLDVIDHYGETDAIDADAKSFTATRTVGSTTLTTVSSLDGMVPGAMIRGIFIPANAKVCYVAGPDSVVVSDAPTSSGSLINRIVGLYSDDDLHPNDFGHRTTFGTMRKQLLAAPMIGPM